MCAWAVALFLQQPDSFSCRDAHAFNRYSHLQVTGSVNASRISLFHGNFQGWFRQSFSLSMALRVPYSWQALKQLKHPLKDINWRLRRPCP